MSNAILAIALVFVPLRERVQTLIDRTFYRGKVNFRRLLPKLSTQLSANLVLEKLIPFLADEIPHRLQITHASLFVLDPMGQKLVYTHSGQAENQFPSDFNLPVDHPLVEHLQDTNLPFIHAQNEYCLEQINTFLDEHEIELSIPLIIGQTEEEGGAMIGLYNLGPKRSGILYTYDEVHVLTMLGKQAAVAVENARLYQKVERYNLSLKQQVEERTTQLAAMTAYLDNILRSAIDYAIITLNYELRINYFNPMAETLYGKSAAEFLGKTIFTIMPQEIDFASVEAGLRNAANGGSHEYRWVQDSKDGPHHISSRISGIFDEQDQLLGYAHFSRDISERLRNENQILAQQRALAGIEERQRLARDLHDSVTQTLHSLSITANTALYLHQQDNPAGLENTLGMLDEAARLAIKEMRLLLFELDLEPEAQTNLFEVLQTRLERVEQRAGIQVNFSLEGAAFIPKACEIELFYIALEALNNALKHAQADQISVAIQASPRQVDLQVYDNGSGFVPEAVCDVGMGFENMATRAAKLGGEVKLESAPGKGTCIHFSAEL